MFNNRRLVMATQFLFGSTGGGLAHGLRGAGWDVYEVDPRQFSSGNSALLGRIVSRLTETANVRAYNRAILEALDHVQPHAFLTVKGEGLQPDTLRELARRGVVSANYYPDVHFRHHGLDSSTFSLFDLFLTTKSFQLAHLRRVLPPERVSFIHHGYASEAHFPRSAVVSESDYVADVTYVGNFAPSKEKWLRAAVRGLPGARFRIIGSSWECAKDSAVRKCAIGHALNGDFYARAVQHSRVNIAVHGGPDAYEGWEDLVSTRTFEIPACKGFMLHVDNAEVRELFEPGREIDVFADGNELIEKIKYYLERPAVRREMVERAYARCVPAYSYDARAKLVSDEIIAFMDRRAVKTAGDDRPKS